MINRVRLAGGEPRFVPLEPTVEGWRLNRNALDDIDTGPVRAMLLMSPSMPTGAVLDVDVWQALSVFCR